MFLQGIVYNLARFLVGLGLKDMRALFRFLSFALLLDSPFLAAPSKGLARFPPMDASSS